MEQLQVRIYLEHVQGAEIAYFYNRESFDLLNIERQEYDKSQFIEIGDIFEYEGKRYKVENINFKMDEYFHKMDYRIGTNLYSPTDPSDFNCQIGIFVDNA